MTIRAVLFDFSGTLFRLEQDGSELPVADGKRETVLHRMSRPTGLPEDLPDELHAAWLVRDLDPEKHRWVNVALLRAIGLHEPGVAEAYYQKLISAESWWPYPDTGAALRRLAAARVPVGVLSNIAWDIRTAFDRHGLAGLVREYVLSYEVGHIKPDPEVFRLACARLGVPPEETLMIGDSEEADGAAAGIGSQVVIVDPLPPADRPGALLAALDQHGLA